MLFSCDSKNEFMLESFLNFTLGFVCGRFYFQRNMVVVSERLGKDVRKSYPLFGVVC